MALSNAPLKIPHSSLAHLRDESIPLYQSGCGVYHDIDFTMVKQCRRKARKKSTSRITKTKETTNDKLEEKQREKKKKKQIIDEEEEDPDTKKGVEETTDWHIHRED